jgi:CRISPR-associated protein Cas1
MKRLLNTLYITTPEAHLCRENETLVVRVESETKLQVPAIGLEGIVCCASTGMTPGCMELCADKGIGVTFLDHRDQFMARVGGPVCGNILLRKEQYRRSDDPAKAAVIARSFVIGKVANCRTALMRAARERGPGPSAESLSKAADGLARIIDELSAASDLELVRGKEGEAGHAYFSVFDHLISAQKQGFAFAGRSRRPPMDAVNALLSFVYTLLAHDCATACETVGLDPQAGFLHADRPGRPGLALDLMEEFRPVLADRLVVSLINRQQIRPAGFKTSESGAVIMSDETRKTVLVAWQERKREEIVHPFTDEKMAVGLLPHIQARLLARHLRGDIDGYPPFFWK